jgi:hypothetical protein
MPVQHKAVRRFHISFLVKGENMSMKKLAVAAALVLGAVSASASNFRGADQVYIPAAGNFQGASGRFVSDVYVANLTPDNVEVSVIFQQLGQGGGTGTEFKNIIKLRGHERKEYKNFLQSALGLNAGNEFGQLIFNGCLEGASCGPETQNEDGVSPNFRAISATSRVYSFPTGPGANSNLTTGQLFTGIPWYHFVSSLQANNGLDKVFIPGFRQTGSVGTVGTYRSNIGLVNASQYSQSTLVVSLYQGTLTAADKKGEYSVDLGPLGSTQVAFSAAFPNSTGENYFVVVEQRNPIPVAGAPSTCVQGCPAFLAYGSVLDNGTGDATTLEAQYLAPLSDAAITVIYPSSSGKSNVRRSVRH